MLVDTPAAPPRLAVAEANEQANPQHLHRPQMPNIGLAHRP